MEIIQAVPLMTRELMRVRRRLVYAIVQFGPKWQIGMKSDLFAARVSDQARGAEVIQMVVPRSGRSLRREQRSATIDIIACPRRAIELAQDFAALPSHGPLPCRRAVGDRSYALIVRRIKEFSMDRAGSHPPQ